MPASSADFIEDILLSWPHKSLKEINYNEFIRVKAEEQTQQLFDDVVTPTC